MKSTSHITTKLNSARTRITVTGIDASVQKMDSIARTKLPGSKKIVARVTDIKGQKALVRVYKVEASK